MITLYSEKMTPHGWKVVIILEALNLPYEAKYFDFSKGEQNSEEYKKINPNRRVPTIIDHSNSDFTLWESSAIVKYLVDRYDKEHAIGFPVGSEESYLVDQWLGFQGTGQGLSYGEAADFILFHSEKLPSAIDRYQTEMIRTISVLDKVLSTSPYLISSKSTPTVADLVFVPCDLFLPILLQGTAHAEEAAKFAHFNKWREALLEHPAVKKMLAIREEVNTT